MKKNLKDLVDSWGDLVSFHMPGHKGRLLFNGSIPLKYDLTEVAGLDNLHNASGRILKLEDELSCLYNSYKSKILVGGSTSGIISALLGCTKKNGLVYANRNAHRSVYNAIKIGGFKSDYFYPDISEVGLPLGFDFISSDSELKLMLENRKPDTVVFTYPTYDGVLYDLKSGIDLVRKYAPDAVIIVDEAHGAHLFLEDEKLSSISMGADIVVHSLHKTLPSLGMTGVIHFADTPIGRLLFEDEDGIQFYLSSIQSSSPSYLMIIGIEEMIKIIKEKGENLNRNLKSNINNFKNRLSSNALTKNLLVDLSKPGIRNCDFSKIILKLNKKQEQRLREEFSIFIEVCYGEVSLFMTSICNNESDFNRLFNALLHIYRTPEITNDIVLKEQYDYYDRCANLHEPDSEIINIEDSVGRMSYKDIIPFPPGVPLILKGEVINKNNQKILDINGIKKIYVYNK